MSWQVASFLILGAVLFGGFAWYERSRPPAQVVALVAALAALAIAGRIAFAAFPNVKPTTDIVVFAGFALGAAPGFAVGALAALVSNFWFGQGPWTPWQMAGWGMCGILGAVLSLGGPNAGRLALATICGLAGILYGALLNFSLMATYGGDLSLERFGVLAARAVPFDVAHVAGNVAFALLAGPAMVRMLTRFRTRFEWGRAEPERDPSTPPRAGSTPRLRGAGLAVLLLLIVLLGALAPAPARASEVSRAAAWLASTQNKDGGFGASPDKSSGAEMTAWAMLGLAAAGRNPLDVSRGGKDPADFLRSALGELLNAGDVARTILAVEAAGLNSRQFGPVDLVKGLLQQRRGNGSYGPKGVGWPGSTAYAILALRAAGENGEVGSSLEWLRKVQNEDGGWGDVPGSPSTADGTGAVLQALAPGSKAAQRGLSFLRRAQRPGGGFALGGNGSVNSQSTAWAIQGILASGADPRSFRRGGASASQYLSARQASDGHYRYSKSSDQTPVWVTSQALVAASGSYLPISAATRTTQPEKKKPEKTGGVSSTAGGSNGSPAPADPATAVPFPTPGDSSTSPAAPGGGSPGVPPNVLRPPGQSESEAPAATEPPAGRERGDTGTPASATSSNDDESSPVGALLLGLAAGALLFGAALGSRRAWRRWRYGE